MTLASPSLVVLASLIHAGWNLLAKRAASVGPVFVFAYNLIACVAYAPWVLYVLAQGNIAWTGAGVGFVLLSGLIHLGYSLCLQCGYQVADLSVVYPVARGTGPMLSTIGAFLILGETPTGTGLAPGHGPALTSGPPDQCGRGLAEDQRPGPADDPRREAVQPHHCGRPLHHAARA